MNKGRKSKLSVESEGKRRYISVPAGLSQQLHRYLRNNRVQCAPPEPAFTGVDNIELRPNSDVAGVQVLLDAWQ
jgi:hypothetical protein